MQFELGGLYATRGVQQFSETHKDFDEFVRKSLNRHIHCDWGELCDEDKELNDDALKNGERLLSKYDYDKNTSIYIITEWDRSATTILFPSEY